jgi:ribosome-associated heat shock protein Hsp15
MNPRIDKFIWATRLCKTRTKAADLVKKGKVKLNGTSVKSSREVKIGDRIDLIKNNATFSYTIKDILDRRIGAKLVEDYLIDITPETELEKYKTFQKAQQNYRHHGTGKPTKKERRALEQFFKKKR